MESISEDIDSERSKVLNDSVRNNKKKKGEKASTISHLLSKLLFFILILVLFLVPTSILCIFFNYQLNDQLKKMQKEMKTEIENLNSWMKKEMKNENEKLNYQLNEQLKKIQKEMVTEIEILNSQTKKEMMNEIENLSSYMNDQLEKIKKEMMKILPKGAIVSWNGSIDEIPEEWVLCNGSNNTPDLRNKFIIGGGDKYNLGQQGGNQSITLKKSNLPKLGEAYLSIPSHNGAHDRKSYDFLKYINFYSTYFHAGNSDEWGANYIIDLNEGFESAPVDIMNPYYSLFYLMKIK